MGKISIILFIILFIAFLVIIIPLTAILRELDRYLTEHNENE